MSNDGIASPSLCYNLNDKIADSPPIIQSAAFAIKILKDENYNENENGGPEYRTPPSSYQIVLCLIVMDLIQVFV